MSPMTTVERTLGLLPREREERQHMGKERRSTRNDRSNAFFLIRAKLAVGHHEEALEQAKKRIAELQQIGRVAEYVELQEMLAHRTPWWIASR